MGALNQICQRLDQGITLLLKTHSHPQTDIDPAINTVQDTSFPKKHMVNHTHTHIDNVDPVMIIFTDKNQHAMAILKLYQFCIHTVAWIEYFYSTVSTVECFKKVKINSEC